MQKIMNYMALYADSHQHPDNVRIHNIFVPLIIWSALGFFHTLMISPFRLSHPIALVFFLSYCVFKNWRLMVILFLGLLLSFISFEFIPHPRAVFVTVFALSWVAQIYGHRLEGNKPTFLRNAIFLWIGPVWVIKKLFPHFVHN